MKIILKLVLLLTSINMFGQDINRDSNFYESKRINILTYDIDQQKLKKYSIKCSKELDITAGLTIKKIDKVKYKNMTKFYLTTSNSTIELYTKKDTLLKAIETNNKQKDYWMGLYFKNEEIIYVVGSPCDRRFPETKDNVKFIQITRFLTQK